MNLEEGLILWLDMNQGLSLTEPDHSEYKNDGTVVGAIRVAGRGCKVLKLDGDDYIVVNYHASLDPDLITMAAWAYPFDNIGNDHILRKDFSSPTYFLVIENSTNKPWTRLATSGGTINVYGDNGIPMNAWTHLAVTYDGSYIRIYVNGELDMTPVYHTGNINADPNDLLIGTFNKVGSFWNGYLDDIRVYNRALSPAEIAYLYRLTRY